MKHLKQSAFLIASVMMLASCIDKNRKGTNEQSEKTASISRKY